MVTEKPTIPDQIIGNIPNAGMVTTTASIVAVATSSACSQNLLLIFLKVALTVKKVTRRLRR